MDLRDTFGSGAGLLDQIVALIRRDGLMDLIGGLNQVGADDQTTSWMGPGANEPVSADRVRDALGPTRSQEIALWREATVMVGLTGPGGCDPYGLALAAGRQGFGTELWFDADQPIFLDRADTEGMKDLMRFVQSEFRTEAEAAMPIHRSAMTDDELTAAVRAGRMVILLIDQCHTHDHHAPHWVLIHAEEGGSFLVNDPWAEPEDGETVADADCLPIARDTLLRMGAYGDPAYHAAIVLSR